MATSFFGRIRNSFFGFFLGLALVAGAFYLLFWNEGRAVHTEKGLKEGSKVVASVGSDRVDPSNQGKLVHLSGTLRIDGALKDAEFGIEAPGVLKLERVVEMFQWNENSSTETTRSKADGGEEHTTTYSYEKIWSPKLIPSENFKHPSDHRNPVTMPYSASTLTADPVHLDAFRLSSGLLAQLTDTVERTVVQADLDRLPPTVKAQAKISDGKFYFGNSPGDPQIGDLRISFQILPASEASVVAQQDGDSFRAWKTRQGTTIEMISRGRIGAVDMFEDAISSNHVMTWVLRVLGLFLMFLGWHLFFGPIGAMTHIPIIGSMVGAGLILVAFLWASALSLGTIALAWFYYRPLLAVVLFLGMAVMLGMLFVLLRKNHPNRMAIQSA